MRVPILTYHGANVSGPSYAENDGVALGEDLRFLHEEGWRVVPLAAAVDAVWGRGPELPARAVVLTCDDATDMDWWPVADHPAVGHHPPLVDRLRAFQETWGPSAQPSLHLTAFAIASRAARSRMSEACLAGRIGMGDGWWREAQASGLMSIENHSWDHNHVCLETPPLPGLSRGHFALTAAAQAQVQVAAAQHALKAFLGRAPRFFAYPYGPSSAYLRDEWLPRHGTSLGLSAAFTDGGAPLETESNRWSVPRYVCGFHWKSPHELAALLQQTLTPSSRRRASGP